MTRRLFFAVLTTAMLIGLGYAGPLRAENFSETASNFVDIHGNEAIRTFGTVDRDKRYARFRKLLMNSFAVKGIAKFITGPYWKKASSEQRRRYLARFEDYLVANYAAKAWKIDKVRLAIQKVVQGNATDYMVSTRLIIPHKDRDIPIGFRIRDTKNGPKIIDLQIENASLIITFRSEFMSLLKKSGGDFDEFIEVIVERTLKLEKTAQNSQQNPQAAAQ